MRNENTHQKKQEVEKGKEVLEELEEWGSGKSENRAYESEDSA